MVSVSIVLPVYNCEGTVRECLGSVLSQTFGDFELILVDDGSTDATPDVAEVFARKDERIRVFRRPREGIVSALNFALSEASGRYVARMDGDDVMLPRRLEMQFRWMEKMKDVSLCGCLVEVESLDGYLSPGVARYRDWSNSLVSHDEIVGEIFVESPIVHPTFFARREFFRSLGGYRDVPWPEDYDLIHRARLKGLRFGKVPEILLTWRDRPDRLVRVDERCKRTAMFRAKAHFFAKARGGGMVAVAGTGPSGRRAAHCLREEGVDVAFFVDGREGPPGRKVMGIPAFGFPGGVTVDFIEKHRDVHFIVCIGEQAGREHFIHRLRGVGFREGEDYTRFL